MKNKGKSNRTMDEMHETMASCAGISGAELKQHMPQMLALLKAAEDGMKYGGFKDDSATALCTIIAIMLGLKHSARPFMADFFGVNLAILAGCPPEVLARAVGEVSDNFVVVH